jgi:hypothetical protein
VKERYIPPYMLYGPRPEAHGQHGETFPLVVQMGELDSAAHSLRTGSKHATSHRRFPTGVATVVHGTASSNPWSPALRLWMSAVPLATTAPRSSTTRTCRGGPENRAPEHQPRIEQCPAPSFCRPSRFPSGGPGSGGPGGVGGPATATRGVFVS